MARKIPERKSTIEQLHEALYSRKEQPHTDPALRTPLSQSREHTPHGWEDIHPPDEKSEQGGPPPTAAAPEVLYDPTLAASVARKLAEGETLRRESIEKIETMPRAAGPRGFAPKRRISRGALYFLGAACIFLSLSIAAAAYLFLEGGNVISSQNIDVSVAAPAIVDAGKPAVIQYVITNRNQEALQSAELVIQYPDGTRSASDLTQNLPQDQISLGDVAPGAQVIQTSSAAFFGAEGSSQKIAVTLQYQLPSGNAIFSKEQDTNIILGSSPVAISVSAPDEAISGQAFDFDITVTSNAATPLSNVGLQAQFPFGFSLNSADPTPDIGGDLWHLGNLNPGETRTIHVNGILTGSDGDVRVFNFLAGSESDLTETAISVPLLTAPLSITVRKPFISSTISINGNTGSSVAAPLGGNVSGTIAWQNNLTDDATHVAFTLTLAGAALDPSSVQTNGFWDSSKSQIVWDEQTDSDLADAAPGGSGTLQFSFKTLAPTTLPSTNPHIDLALAVSADRAGQGNVPEVATSSANLSVNLASLVTLNVQSLHFTGAFASTGPMPPVHDQATTYTILWSLKNSSNAIGQGAVTTTLPPYVQFVAAQSGSAVSYDATTRRVTWTLGDIAASAGYGTAAPSAAFQVSLTPSVSQVGTSPALTSQATFTGQDRFAGVPVTTTVEAPTTLLNESGFTSDMDQVK